MDDVETADELDDTVSTDEDGDANDAGAGANAAPAPPSGDNAGDSGGTQRNSKRAKLARVLAFTLVCIVAGAVASFMLPETRAVGRVTSGLFAAGAFLVAFFLFAMQKGPSFLQVGFALVGFGAVLDLFGSNGIDRMRANAMRAENRKVAAVQHAADLTGVPERLKEIEAFIAKGDWERAADRIKALRKIDRKAAGLSALSETVATAQARIAAEYIEAKRQRAMRSALEIVPAIVKDRERCRQAKDVADGWELLSQFKSSDEHFPVAKKLAAKLERCRKKSRKSFRKHLNGELAKMRVSLAKTLENNYLDRRINAKVRASGKGKTRLKVTWFGVSAVTAREFETDQDQLRQLAQAGFSKLVLYDGYSESWSFDLRSMQTADSWDTAFAKLGLGADLTLEP